MGRDTLKKIIKKELYADLSYIPYDLREFFLDDIIKIILDKR